MRTIRDGEPRTATSTFKQPLNSVRRLPHLLQMLLYIYRNDQDY